MNQLLFQAVNSLEWYICSEMRGIFLFWKYSYDKLKSWNCVKLNTFFICWYVTNSSLKCVQVYREFSIRNFAYYQNQFWIPRSDKKWRNSRIHSKKQSHYASIWFYISSYKQHEIQQYSFYILEISTFSSIKIQSIK